MNRPPAHIAVRERIERMILTGELQAGDRLNENELASEMHVSRAPVREATRALSEAGLLTIVRNRGAFVREISLEEALDLYDLRSGYSRVAGRLAALRATPKQVADLEELWSHMETARAAGESDTYYDVNRVFHARIVEASGNRRLIAMHESNEKELMLFLRRGVIGPLRLDASNRDHRRMLDGIAQGDEKLAARAFEEHVLAGKQRMLDTLSWRSS